MTWTSNGGFGIFNPFVLAYYKIIKCVIECVIKCWIASDNDKLVFLTFLRAFTSGRSYGHYNKGFPSSTLY